MSNQAKKPVAEKIPTVNNVQRDIAKLVSQTAAIGDKLRKRLDAHCQSDDAQILGMVQGAQCVLIEAHERMAS